MYDGLADSSISRQCGCHLGSPCFVALIPNFQSKSRLMIMCHERQLGVLKLTARWLSVSYFRTCEDGPGISEVPWAIFFGRASGFHLSVY